MFTSNQTKTSTMGPLKNCVQILIIKMEILKKLLETMNEIVKKMSARCYIVQLHVRLILLHDLVRY